MRLSVIEIVFGMLLVLLYMCSCSGENRENGEKRESRKIVLATTTSTYDTGLLDHLIPLFEKRTGDSVKTIAVGTGQALELGRRGEADVLLVHAPSAEEEFVAKGHGTNRRAVMHNDFVIVGPAADPAGVGGGKDASSALKKLAAKDAQWISRGDRSGTHHKERALWKTAGLEPSGSWFIETGQGMGATLRIASERQAYTLADRGTFLAVENLQLKIHVEEDPALFNPYHVIEVRHERVEKGAAKRLADFFVAKETQKRIGEFRVRGFTLFTPDARK